MSDQAPGEWDEIVRELFASIPGPVRKLLFLKCPRCGHRIWNAHGAEDAGYQSHYLDHIIDDEMGEDAR